jgi:hypothetical protein
VLEMSLMTRTPALRMLLVAAAAVVAAAVPASAGLGLPVALPAAQQQVSTPVSSHSLSAGAHGADVCNAVATPALPSLPVPPVPIPVPLPALPSASAAADTCVHAGLDGVSASLDGDAAGSQIGAAASAEAPDVGKAGSDAKGILETIVDTLFGWI